MSRTTSWWLFAQFFLILGLCAIAVEANTVSESAHGESAQTASDPLETANSTVETPYVYPTDSMEPAAGICPGLGWLDFAQIFAMTQIN